MLPVVEHWDGRAWHVVPTPELSASAGLSDVTALSRNDVWAVGRTGSRPLYEHWDGRRWHAIVGERDAALYAVDGAASDNVWAVGSQGLLRPSVNDISGVSLRWDGRRWQGILDPQDTGDQEGLDGFSGVDVLSPTDVWTMRATYSSRWDGRRWHDFPIPIRASADGLFADIASAGPHDIWGVGELDFKYPLIVHWNGRAWRTQPTPFQRLRGTNTQPSLRRFLSPSFLVGGVFGAVPNRRHSVAATPRP
jgi:hypothetical protein